MVNWPPKKSGKTDDRGQTANAEGHFTKSLLYMALFLAVSIAFAKGLRLSSVLPSSLLDGKEALSPATVSSVLMLYAFSAILLLLCRIMTGNSKGTGLQHLFFLTGFFIFYEASGALESNMAAVVVAGVTIFTLNAYRSWSLGHNRETEL